MQLGKQERASRSLADVPGLNFIRKVECLLCEAFGMHFREAGDRVRRASMDLESWREQQPAPERDGTSDPKYGLRERAIVGSNDQGNCRLLSLGAGYDYTTKDLVLSDD